MFKLLNFIIFLCMIVLISACNTTESTTQDEPKHWHVGGDLREETSSIETLPTMLAEKDDSIKEIYLSAAKHPEILRYMPCYCGCSISAGHKDSSACFYSEIREDGSIVWDNHGAKCMTCLEIAKTSVAMFNEGKSLYEIRTTIDTYYTEKGYKNPTPTKMPQK
ncbi:hypothetical protein CIB95_12370 [Lottiidibacillus patelloidae]|uniref:Lipoprotein n=1 Tax=Lottiidibacillus patelloidae TaxID=2670334 RepID=A0A263BR86_9BACI|nr:PCYCGC motif-containing (lipo)protein [Lottiidibacillus patelloidae]OZM56215.1 hypothetical protein CIB95_12370 [Lottiidibacillus patelloidae]